MERESEDALRWEGDEQAPAAAVPDPALPEGWNAVGKGSESVGRVPRDGTVTPAGEPAPLGSVSLVAIGVIAGVYALYIVGWIIGGFRLREGLVQTSLVSDFSFYFMFWLAVAAPLLWFAAAWLTTRRSAVWVRIVSLVVGMLVLVPWPFVLVGAIGGMA